MAARRLPRPPDPGTPAFTAAYDQHAAAVKESTEAAAALLADHPDTVLVAPHGPWAAATLSSVAPERPRRGVCTTVGASTGPIPLFVVYPQLLMCRLCFDHMHAAHRHAQIVPCHQCGRAWRPAGPAEPFRPVLAQRLQVVAWGRLCPACLFAEQRTPEPLPGGSP